MEINTNEIYHSDHLGSSSYITDNFGRPSHYYEYLPFGELMTEHNQSKYYLEPYPTQNMDSYNNPYKFNGKEMDRETGMYYYGARYYDPRISIFVSVDPLAEQTMEPYLYTGNNPIMFTDPTGMSKDGIDTHFVNDKGETIANTDDGSNEVIVIRRKNEDKFTKELAEKVKTKEDLNPEVNKALGEQYGYSLDKIKEEGGRSNYPKEIQLNDAAWEYGYTSVYEGKGIDISLSGDKGGTGSNYFEGRGIARKHLKEGRMNIFAPILKNKPAHNYIRTSRERVPSGVNHRKYSDKPIPLLINEM